jgi:hypothetical protein
VTPAQLPSGRPVSAAIQHCAEQLLADRSWQDPFSDDERGVLIVRSLAYIRLQAQVGLDLDDAYKRVLVGLKAMAAWMPAMERVQGRSDGIRNLGHQEPCQ